MKKFKIIFVMVCGLFFNGVVAAETKIAVVDVMTILQQMPQRETLMKKLDSEFSPKAKALQNEKKKAEDAAIKLQKEGMILSASEKTKLTNIVSAYEDKANSFNADFRKRESEEANKLLSLISETVKKIAEKEQYDVVLKAEAAFYYVNAVDISDKVLNQVKK